VLPVITATTYLTALREGGSLPGLVEADDSGTYVVKFTGAGQGTKALVAEIVVGELGRRLGIKIPEMALIEIDAEMGRREPDQEVQSLINASVGLNLAIDFLPGSVGYDRSFDIEPADIARILWLDAYVSNVDRSARNTNLLIWHRTLWAIDHGACLRFHHAWGSPEAFARSSYGYGDHVLGGRANPRSVHEQLSSLVDAALVDELLDLVPDAWLLPDPTRPDPKAPPDAATARRAYRTYLQMRLAAAEQWLP
jgi:hypothetical protein